MNRAERRRIEKAKGKVHTMTHEALMYDKGFRDGMKEGIRSESGMTTRLFTTCLSAVLHDEFGFGRKRLETVLEHVTATLESIRDDKEHERKIREWIKAETGIDLDDYTGGRTIDLRDELQTYYDMGIKKGAKDEST